MLLKSKHFPYLCGINNSFKNVVVIGIGANISDCIRTFDSLFDKVRRNIRFFIQSTSIIYKNKAFGLADQPDFYNATMILFTNLSVRDVFSYMFYLERYFGRGRMRYIKNGPRKLDLDLIFFNGVRVRLGHMIVPHKEWRNRISVVLPLSYHMPITGTP